MTGICYIGLFIGLHGDDLPEPDGQFEGRIIEALRSAFPEHFGWSGDITVEISESAGEIEGIGADSDGSSIEAVYKLTQAPDGT